MQDALGVVRDVYSRFASGDIDGFLDLCADDIEWVVNGPSSLEKCRAFKGRAGVQQFLGILDNTWVFSDFSPREFIANAGTVVVLGEETGSYESSNIPFKNRWAHVFDIQDGAIIRFREFLCHWPGGEQPPEMSWTDG